MAKDIKMKEKATKKKSNGSVGKTADRAKIISVKAKDGIVEDKNNVQEKTTTKDDRSPEQYATEEVTEGMRKALEDVGVVADKAVRIGTRKIKEKVKQNKTDKTEKTEISDDVSEDKPNLQKPEKKTKDKTEDKNPTGKKNKTVSKSDKAQSDGKTQADAQSKPHTEIDKAERKSDVPRKQQKPVGEKKKPKQRKQTPPKTRG